jgi:hypothetical protein
VSEEPASRVGSGADLSRRLEKVELNHESLAKEVAGLTSTVNQVELNQRHAEELNKLRFGSLDQAIITLRGEVAAVGGDLKGFMSRIEGLITGETELPQQRALMADWSSWRKDVDEDREGQRVLNGQMKLLGRLAVLLVTSNVLTVVGAAYALLSGHH